MIAGRAVYFPDQYCFSAPWSFVTPAVALLLVLWLVVNRFAARLG